MTVALRLLKSSPELNGRIGTIKGFNTTSGRFAVALDPTGLASPELGTVSMLENARVVHVKPANLLKSEALRRAATQPGDTDITELDQAATAIVMQTFRDLGEQITGFLEGRPPKGVLDGTMKLLDTSTAPPGVVTRFEDKEAEGIADMEPEEMTYRLPVPDVGGFAYAVVYRGARGVCKIQTSYRKECSPTEKHFAYDLSETGRALAEAAEAAAPTSSSSRHVNVEQ